MCDIVLFFKTEYSWNLTKEITPLQKNIKKKEICIDRFYAQITEDTSRNM